MDTSVDKSARTQEPSFVRRVLWCRGRIIVYQHVDGRYMWADLNTKKQRRVLIAGGLNAA